MASTRAIMASPNPRPLHSPHDNVDHLLKLDDTTPPKKHRQIPNKNENKHTTFNADLGAISPESLEDGTSDQDDDAESEGESDDDEAEDDDNPDVIAPSSDIISHPEQPHAGANAQAGQSEVKKEDEGNFYDSDSDMADHDEENFDINEDDDDYDGVDRMSVTSDGSDMFEEEVENEILAAGEQGIDWDDEETYGYVAAANSEYFLPAPHVDGGIDYMGFSYADFDFDTEAATPNVTPITQEATPVFVPKPLSPRMSWSMSESSDSSHTARSEASNSASRRASLETGETGLTQFSLRDGHETDDEELPPPPASSPAVKSSTKTPKRSSSPKSRLITDSTPRKVGLKRPVLAKIKLNPNKPVAYSVDGPRVMKFLTPKGSTLKWIDMRRFDSDTDDSSPNSPTMIDLDIALGDGNTRTGAAITDTLHGIMFRQHHCDPDLWVSDFTVPEPSATVEFARVPFINNGSRSFSALFEYEVMAVGDDMVDGTGLVADDPALDLIDFDGGVGCDEIHEEVQAADDTPSSDPPQADLEMTGMSTSLGSTASSSNGSRRKNGKGKATVRSATPPNEEQFSAMDITSSSPLKRRANNVMADAGSVSPISKRKCL